MNLQEIERGALQLPKEQIAKLIQRLVLSLESHSEDEILSDWFGEAQ